MLPLRHQVTALPHTMLCLKQVACGGFHTLAVVRHDPREAGEDAARRGVRQWAKPKPELTVGAQLLDFRPAPVTFLLRDRANVDHPVTCETLCTCTANMIWYDMGGRGD